MKSLTVKDLMVPIGEYATVCQEANLYEAIIALEKAQATVDPGKHKHRAIVVMDDQQKVVGKISMFRVLIALEPKYQQLEAQGVLSRSGYSQEMIDDMLKDSALWSEPMSFLCNRASQLKVTDFMESPAEGAFIDENATLDTAIHQMVLTMHQSLVANSGDKTVGVLRLSDVFAAICDQIRTCKS